MAATVAYVHDDRLINISVVDHSGVQSGITSVRLAQDDEPVEPGMCYWMDYQKEQAAKSEYKWTNY